MLYKEEDIKSAQAMQKKWRNPASVALGQFAIESACGRFEPHNSNNGLGIQALPGYPSVESPSHEEVNGKLVPVTERFAVFTSHDQMFDAYGKLVSTGSAYRGAMQYADDADKFVDELGHYSSTSNYREILKARIKADNLTQYDKPVPMRPVTMAFNNPITMTGLMTSVKTLQVALNRLGAEPALRVDGHFGVLTEAAVKKFQESHLDPTAEGDVKLEADGMPGARTNTAIIEALATKA